MAFRRPTVRSRSAPPFCSTTQNGRAVGSTGRWSESTRNEFDPVQLHHLFFASMPYFVYVLKSETTDTSYVGHTSSPEKRLMEHNNGKSLSTKGKRPWRLVYNEKYLTRSEAASREKYLKSVKGRLELKAKGIL